MGEHQEHLLRKYSRNANQFRNSYVPIVAVLDKGLVFFVLVGKGAHQRPCTQFGAPVAVPVINRNLQALRYHNSCPLGHSKEVKRVTEGCNGSPENIVLAAHSFW